jgi:Lipid A 3-O-deacylase (PagL)
LRLRVPLLLALVAASAPAAVAAEWRLAGGYGRTIRLGPTNSDVGYAALLPQGAWALSPRLQYVVEGHVSRWFGPDAWTAGLVPVGARLVLGDPTAARAPYVSIGAGFAWTGLEDLEEIDRRFNYVLQGSVGVRFEKGWIAEARFLHLSNGNTAGRNLGINAVTVLLGSRL